MAVTKIWPVHDSVSRVVDYCNNPEKTKLTDLGRVIDYASDSTKTLDKEEQSYAVTGINCNAKTASKEMRRIQERFGKTSGNIAYHAYQSFKTGEVTAEDCHRIGVELAKRLWGDKYQVVVATHFNTGTYHNHFVVNAVSMWDGKKMPAKYGSYYRMRAESDRICKENGLSVIDDPQHHKTARSVYFAEKNGEPTRFNLMREALDEAISMSRNWYELSLVLKKKGYILDQSYRQSPTLRAANEKKSIRIYRLGEQYRRENLSDVLYQNTFNPDVHERYRDLMDPYEYSREYARAFPPSKEYFRKHSFYKQAPYALQPKSLLDCIAIMLGIKPLYRNTYVKPLSAELKEASRRMDRYTAEITLASHKGLRSFDDIKEFISDKDRLINEFYFERSRLKNRLRRCKDSDEREGLKALSKECTKILSELRRDRDIAQNIIEDSPKFKELLHCEYEAYIETNPYFTEKEKKIIRSEIKKGHNHER